MRKTLYTVITALTAALAAHAADTGKIDYNTMETRWKNAYDYTPGMLSDSYHIPEVAITNKESLGTVTDNRSVTLDLSAIDAETPL